MTLKFAVLISGNGSHLTGFIDAIKRKELDAQLVSVVSTNPHSRGLEVARTHHIETKVVSYKEHGSQMAAQVIYDACRQADLIAMAGFLKLLPVEPQWEGRIINIHPSLLPKYGGKGFYKMRVHEAVIEAGDRVSGCSIHLVDNEYDHGPLLEQLTVTVDDGETPESLQKKVFEQEKILYLKVLKNIARGEWALPLNMASISKRA